MQVDAAVLFERVSNALKLLGDQYLARVYRSASQRLRLSEWNGSIVRKRVDVEVFYQPIVAWGVLTAERSVRLSTLVANHT